MNDVEACIREAEMRQAAVEEISDGCARTAANMFHNGQGSVSYSFVSTGAISDPSEVWRDLFAGIHQGLTAGERLLADMLGTYLTSKGARGPQPGWSQVWVR